MEFEGSLELARITYFQTRGLPVQPKPSLIKNARSADRRVKGNIDWITDRLPHLGFMESQLGDFYDVAAKDAKMFQRFDGVPEGIRLQFHDRHRVVHHARLSLLLSATGHYVLGICLEQPFGPTSDALDKEAFRKCLRDLSALSQEQLESESQQGSWHLEIPFGGSEGQDTATVACTASIRRVFDLLGFAIHEALLDRAEAPSTLERWSRSWNDSEERSREIHRLGEVATPYVATWGYHAEIHGSDRSDGISISPEEVVDEMLSTRGITSEDVATPVATRRAKWLIGDFESIRVTAEQPRNEMDSSSALNSHGFVEYLAFRRGVVTLIQRDMLRCSINLAEIRRKQVADWDWALSTTTDDYVLAGWNVGLLRRVRSSSSSHLGTWDLGHREEQARQHLVSLREQFQAEQGRLSTALSLIFGIIAFSSLLPVVSFALAWITGSSSVSDVPLDQPAAFTVVSLILFGVLLTLSFRLVRRAGTLRPPSRGP